MITRADSETRLRSLLEEAFELAPVAADEAVIAIAGAPAFAISRLKTRELFALRCVLLRIVMEARG